jgi:hypothetical protein
MWICNQIPTDDICGVRKLTDGPGTLLTGAARRRNAQLQRVWRRAGESVRASRVGEAAVFTEVLSNKAALIANTYDLSVSHA